MMQNTQPPIIDHFRPKLSVIQPLKGLANNALIEKAGMIQPKCFCPPSDLRKFDNSGKMMLNDKKKKSAPPHIIQNSFGYFLSILLKFSHQRHNSAFSESFRTHANNWWRLVSLVFVGIYHVYNSFYNLRIISFHGNFIFTFASLNI